MYIVEFQNLTTGEWFGSTEFPSMPEAQAHVRTTLASWGVAPEICKQILQFAAETTLPVDCPECDRAVRISR